MQACKEAMISFFKQTNFKEYVKENKNKFFTFYPALVKRIKQIAMDCVYWWFTPKKKGERAFTGYKLDLDQENCKTLHQRAIELL